ncbi:MAG TPA: YlxR family protein [Candidatus Limnocylindrales bacterium]
MHRVPTRTCVACRTSRGKRELVRIVRTPDGRMMMDASGRLAGRGAYLCDDPACRRTALDKNILTRALRVPLPDDLRSALEEGAEHTNTPGGTIGQE